MTQEQEDKLNALQAEIAMYRAIAEQKKKESEEIKREIQKTKAETEHLKVEIEYERRRNAFLKEFLKNAEEH